MEWKNFFATMAVAAIIIFIQWPSMKQNPKKDKAAFAVLLLIGLALSIFDLPHIKGISSLQEALFKPIGRLMLKSL